ncbi:hypothetical protein ACQUY5_16805 [Bacillus cereus]|uniref:hypothetical protein n=1 Tax=Bacillus cereus TaxID=1396 RepID=UPI003D177470
MNENIIPIKLVTEYGDFMVGTVKQDKEGKLSRPEIPFEQVVVSPTILTKPTVEAHINLEGYFNCNHKSYFALVSVTHVIREENIIYETEYYILSTGAWKHKLDLEYLPFEPYHNTIEGFHNYIGKQLEFYKEVVSHE